MNGNPGWGGRATRLGAIGLCLTWSLASCAGVAPGNQSAEPSSLPSPASSSPSAVTRPSAAPTPSPTPHPEFSSKTEPSTTAPAGAIAVEMAGPPPHYLPGELATPAGQTVLFVTNSSRGTHNVAIGRGPLNFKLGRATNLPLALSGNVLINTSVSFSVDGLPPGAYLFWCTISDHAQEGMTGTLTVTP